MTMKITPVPFTPASVERVRKNEDAAERERRQGQRREESGKKEEREKFDLEKLGRELDSFTQEASSQAYGLNARMEGTGPGLRVTLKDGTGAVIRQFTGEEFLQLREAAQTSGRGRILDKKL